MLFRSPAMMRMYLKYGIDMRKQPILIYPTLHYQNGGIKIADNGGNNSQVKEGTITITLFAGATLKINGYSGYTDYTLSDGTTTYVVDKNTADHTGHIYTAEGDVTGTITPNSGNNYFYGIEITY